MSTNHAPMEEFPDWKDIEEIGAGDGLPTECERCGNPGPPRQQFEHMGVVICYICVGERADARGRVVLAG